MSPLHGIDVSANNPHPINWPDVARAGASFAIIKLTELSVNGEYVNPHKDIDIASAKAVGLDVAGYSYIHPDVDASKTVAFLKANSAGCYRLFIDSEVTPPGWTWGHVGQVTEACLKLLGPRAALYANANYITNMPGAPWGYGLWLAEYGPSHPSISCLFWQYAQTGRWPGVSGNVDTSLYYGTEPQLHEYFSPPK